LLSNEAFNKALRILIGKGDSESTVFGISIKSNNSLGSLPSFEKTIAVSFPCGNDVCFFVSGSYFDRKFLESDIITSGRKGFELNIFISYFRSYEFD